MVILIGLLVCLIFGILPMVVYALILWWFDRYEKEPWLLLIAAFLWGAVPSIIFSLIAQLVLGIPLSYFVGPGLTTAVVEASVIAPLTEEFFKALALVLMFLIFRREIDSPLDGIIYGALVGFGFAAVENVLYFVSEFAGAGVGGVVVLSFFRALLFGLNHALFTGLIGLGLALAVLSRHWLVRLGAPLAGLIAGMTAHGIHNLGATMAAITCWSLLLSLFADWGGVLLLFVVIIWTSVRERRWIVEQLGSEVAVGTLTQEEYEVICSYWQRVGARLRGLARGEVGRWWRLGKYFRLATELAFNKHRWEKQGRDRATGERIEGLRGELCTLRAQL